MPSNRASTVIAYADCTQKPDLALVRYASRPAALSNGAALRLYPNGGSESQLASASTSPNSVLWPPACFSASFFRAVVSYDGGSWRSGAKLAAFVSSGTASSCAWPASTAPLAIERPRPATDLLVEYTMGTVP